MMTDYDFMLNEDQIELRNLVREFAEKEVRPTCRIAEKDAIVPEDLVKTAYEMGLHLVTVPEEYGGLGLDNFTYAVIREELARGDAGFASRVFGFGFEPLNIAGTEEQKKWAADIMVNGGIMAFGLTESVSGSNAGAMVTTARKVGDDYVINGGKTFITNGALADVFVGFFKTDPAGEHRGISAFIIDADAKGVTVGAHENKMGLRLSNTTDLIFDNVRVKASSMVGPEGSGFKLALNALNLSRAFVATLAVGIMQRALDGSVKYAKERKQFNTPIIKYQMVQQMLADMAIKIEASRCLVNNTMRMMDQGIMVQKEGSICKTFVSDCAQEVTSNAVQIFGGYGYSKEYPVEKLMRDCKVFQIFEGANQIQRMTIANVLNKEYK